MDCSGNVKIDFHVHSTASDGTLSPSEILLLAEELNLKAISITDHDTVDGSREALQTGIPSCLHFLTGVEISTSFPHSFQGRGSLHVLGYNINIYDTSLNQTLLQLRQARKNRNPHIIKQLNDMGISLSLSELLAEFSTGQLGRPHIAQMMVQKGYVKSIDEAFEKYLRKGKPAYVEKSRVGCDIAIKNILDAGGIPVLAHPGLIHLKERESHEELIGILKNMGLMGIEVYYPEHTPEETEYFQSLADRLNLLATGGTDFHGDIKPEIQLGIGKGDFKVPCALYEKFRTLFRNKFPE